MKQLFTSALQNQAFAFSPLEIDSSVMFGNTQGFNMVDINRGHVWGRSGCQEVCQLESELYNEIGRRETDFCEEMDSVCVQLKSASIDDITDSFDEHFDDLSIDGPKDIVATDAKHVFRKDSDGDTLLHVAIILQNVQDAMRFIDMAPVPEYLSIQNELFQSPLHLSALTDLPKVSRRLVVGGANIESRDRAGNTPLHLACREGHSDIVDAILKTVSDDERRLNMYDVQYKDTRHVFEIPNYEGLLCIHLAALKGHYTLVSKLVELGADINSYERKSGRTLLHKAAAEGDADFVKMLLTVPSLDINARAFDDRTPFDLARDRGFHEITFLLASECTRRAALEEMC